MAPVQLQQASSSSLFWHARFSPASVPARMCLPARRALRVQAAVQPDMMVAAATLAATTVDTAFKMSLLGGALGAVQAMSRPGDKKPILQEATLNANGMMRVGALMGLSAGTLSNLGLERLPATCGGAAIGIALYAALVTTMNQSK
jgi:hypothetical protein